MYSINDIQCTAPMTAISVTVVYIELLLPKQDTKYMEGESQFQTTSQMHSEVPASCRQA